MSRTGDRVWESSFASAYAAKKVKDVEEAVKFEALVLARKYERANTAEGRGAARALRELVQIIRKGDYRRG